MDLEQLARYLVHYTTYLQDQIAETSLLATVRTDSTIQDIATQLGDCHKLAQIVVDKSREIFEEIEKLNK